MKKTVFSFPQLFDEDGAAEYLGIRPQTLAVWRCTGRYQLAFVKVGHAVRYKLADLQTFLAERTVKNTAQGDRLDKTQPGEKAKPGDKTQETGAKGAKEKVPGEGTAGGQPKGSAADNQKPKEKMGSSEK